MRRFITAHPADRPGTERLSDGTMIPTLEIDDADGSFYVAGIFIGRLAPTDLIPPTDLIQLSTTTLTVPSAALLTLRENPVQLLPAPGDGLIIQVLAVSINSVGGTLPYAASGAGSTFDIGYTTDGKNNLTNDISGQTVAKIPPWITLMNGWNATITGAAINDSLWLLNCGNKDYTGGNCDIAITLTYKFNPISI